jgi:nucleoside-diphosphate-sugar epimerase
MNIVVTGANGFVGRRVVEWFAGKGVKVFAATRQPVEGLPVGARRVPAPDLQSSADWTGIVAGADVVVHCAARVHVMDEMAEDPLVDFRRLNVDATLALATAAAAAGVKRFVFISSVKVNGEHTALGHPFRADDPPAPVDPYGISKKEAEENLFELSRRTGLEIVVIRPVLVYGPGVQANFRAMMKVVARGVPLPLGATANKRSMVYIDNLADLIFIAATHGNAAGKIFLVSDGEDLSTTQILRMLGQAMGKKPILVPIPALLISSLAALVGKGTVAQRLFGSLQVDISYTREILGWSPPVAVEEGLARTAEDYLAEQKRAR